MGCIIGAPDFGKLSNCGGVLTWTRALLIFLHIESKAWGLALCRALRGHVAALPERAAPREGVGLRTPVKVSSEFSM